MDQVQFLRFFQLKTACLSFLTAEVSCFIELQGVYSVDMESSAIQVDTFCVHGGPDGYITGIRGRVQCLAEEDLEKSATDLEKQEMIKEKCYLRFPTLPFIPKEPYDVLATDYDTFALVSGAKDRSFIQVITYLVEKKYFVLEMSTYVSVKLCHFVHGYIKLWVSFKWCSVSILFLFLFFLM